MQLVTCPRCGGGLQHSVDLVGQQVLCPHCGCAVLMPSLSSGAPSIPTALPGPPPPPPLKSAGHMSGCAIAIVAILATTCIFGVLGLAVLGSMVAVGYKRVQQGAMVNIASSQISVLESAVNMYVIHMGSPPTNRQGLQALVVRPAELIDLSKWNGPYLEEAQLPLDPWNNPYQYELIDQENGVFRIWSNGPDATEATADDISTLVK